MRQSNKTILLVACCWLFDLVLAKKCVDQCGGEKHSEQMLYRGEHSCYRKKSWFFGMDRVDHASECEIKKCKLGREEPDPDQKACWCDMCTQIGRAQFCYEPGSEDVESKGRELCEWYFCGKEEYAEKYGSDTRELKYRGKYCNWNYRPGYDPAP